MEKTEMDGYKLVMSKGENDEGGVEQVVNPKRLGRSSYPLFNISAFFQ